MPRSYRIVREDADGTPSDDGLPVIRDGATGEVIDSPYESTPAVVDDQGEELTPPPLSGRGSGRDAWVTYAEAVGLVVEDATPKREIIEQLRSLRSVAPGDAVDDEDGGE